MYRPLPDTLSIGRSEIEGVGLFAVEEIPANTILGITHVQTSEKEFENGWIRTPLGGFYNHSDTPNCYIGKRYLDTVEIRELITLKDLKLGDELTCTYTIWAIEKILNIDFDESRYI
jgi:SET domain-containing protein